MNNLRKTAVLLLCGVFFMSIAFAPFTPMAKVDSQVAPSPVDYEAMFEEKWADRLMNDFANGKMDPILASYMETGLLDDKVVTTANGAIKLLLYISPDADASAIAKIGKLRWQMDLKIVRIASVDVTSAFGLKMLEARNDVLYIMPDMYLEPTPVEAVDEFASPDMYHIRDIVGATGTYASNYDGSGAIVAVMDSGVDFSQPDLIGAEYNNGTTPMSYDPSSFGLTAMVIGNCTPVSNITAWLEDGNLLTYESGGKYYVNVSGWDPIINNGGGGLPLKWWMDYLGGLYSINNFTEFIENVIWNDWEIPTPTANNYTFGWVQERRSCSVTGGYSRLFAPAMIYEGDVIIDWNGTLAFTTMFMEAYYWETIDLNVTADRNYISDMMDWSFVDDIAEGYVFNGANNVLVADIDDDGTVDLGLGSLSWAYDELEYLDTYYGVFNCITDDWLAFNVLFTGGTPDDNNHGHWTSAAVASRGVFDHNIYGNGTLYKLPGVAPGAKLIFTKGLSAGGYIMADFWAAGFHLNETSGYWEYIGDGPSHHAHMVSNSWGWGPGAAYLQIRYFTMVYDIASVPGVLDPAYPGTLFVFSAGNEGADYGTAGTPGASFSVISVGASTASHYYIGAGATDTYSPWQEDNQEIFFSSHGPGFTGIVKPDVMAPGYRGASPQPFPQAWVGTGATFFWWQGTSLSCPIAAGVAALIIEAYHTAHGVDPTPQQIKDILLSTATDMGTDPFSQGHGLVNAEAACKAIETGATDEYVFESDSFDNYGDQIADAWSYWMAPATAGSLTGIGYPTSTPVGLETSSVFFGTVERGEAYTVNLDVTDFVSTDYDTAAFDTITPWYYRMQRQIVFDETSYRYFDGNFRPFVNRPGWFVLTDYMTPAEEADFWAANYVTIQVTHNAALTGSYPIVRLFDWDDLNADNYLNYWNITEGTGDYLAHVSRYYDPCNLMTMRVGSTNTMAGVFTYDPTLQFDAAGGIDFTVTITVWEKATDGDIVIADGSTSGIDVTLNVDPAAEYGAHQGSILFVDASSGFTHQVPYSYMVNFHVVGAEGTENVLVDTFGDELTPYETGAVTTSFIYGTTSTQEAGGLKSFHVEIPYDNAINASILVMRAEWTNPGTVVDFSLRSETGGEYIASNYGGTFFDPVVTGDLTNVVILDGEGDLINGTYWFYYAVRVFDGADVPENITITMRVLGDRSFTSDWDFTWWAGDQPTPTAIAADDVLTGDHVYIRANWTLPTVSGLPEYSIRMASIDLLSGLYAPFEGDYADPLGTDAWPVPLTSTNIYVWHTVEGISAGDNVRIALDAQGGADPSFDVWAWDDANDNGLVDLAELGGSSLLSVDNGGSGSAESGSYISPASMDIAIRVFCWAWVFDHQSYELTVDTRTALTVPGGGDITFDTYSMLRTGGVTNDIQLYCYTSTDVNWVVNFGKVTFNNFFAPELAPVNNAISLGNDRFNFTWTAGTDRNADDSIFYQVWVSADGGSSFYLVAGNLTETYYVWDSDGWLEGNYYYRIRAYDCDLVYTIDGEHIGSVDAPPDSYFPGFFVDRVSNSFAAGNVPPTTPPPTTTTPTEPTTPTTTPPPLDPLLIGLIGGIGVGVVVLLILFLIRKK